MAKRVTDEAAVDQGGKRSRRAILTAAGGALGVLGVETLAQATPAQAGTDGDVVLGPQTLR